MKKILFIACAGLFIPNLTAQILPPIDCTEAISICDSIETQDTLKVPVSFSANEISNNSCLPFGEIRGTWYKFGVNVAGNLRFTITPLDTTVDFDWALFNTTWLTCTDIFGVPSYEISCNASGIGGGNYTTGATGLAQPGHNPAISVTMPTSFFLYVTTSMQDTNAVLGYTIDFSASDFYLVNCNEIGIENYHAIPVNIYPNPVTDHLQVQLGEMDQNTTVRLFDINGKNVRSYQATDPNSLIDVSSLAPGMYLLEVQNSQGVSMKKVLKH